MADYNAGSASIKIRPNLDGFIESLRGELNRYDVDYQVDIHAQTAGFAEELHSELTKIEARYGVPVDPDMDGFASELRTRLESLDPEVTVNVDADTTAAATQIEALSTSRSATITVDADTAAAEAQIATVARDREVNLHIDANALSGAVARAGLLSSAIAGIGGAAGAAAGLVGGLGVGLIGLSTTALPIVAAIGLGMEGIGTAAKEAAPAFGELKSAISETFATDLAPMFQQIGRALTSWTPALQSVASSLAGVTDGFVSVFTTGQGVQVVNGFLASTSVMLDRMGSGVVTLATGFQTLMAGIAPHMASIGAGLGDLLGGIGGAFTTMQQMGILTPVFQSLGPALAGLGAGLGDILVALGQMGAAVLPQAEGLFRSLGESILGMAGPLGQMGAVFVQAITPLLPVVSQLVGAIAGALTPVLPILSQVVQTIGTGLAQAIQAAAPALAPLAQAFGSIVQAVAPLLPVIGQLVGQIAGALAPVISQIATSLGPPLVQILGSVGQAFGSIVTAMAPVISSLVSALAPVLQSLAPVFQQLAGMIGQVAGTIGGFLVAAIQTLAPFLPPLMQAFMQILQAVMPLVPLIINLVVSALQPMLPVITSLMPAVISLVQVIASIVTAVAPVLGILIQLNTMFTQVLGTILMFVGTAIGHIVSFVAGFIANVTSLVSSVVGAFTGMASGVTGRVSGMVSSVLSTVVSWWTNMTSTVSQGIANVVSKIGELPGRIKGVFSSAGSWLVSAGRDVVAGLINGITQMMGAALDRVRHLGSEIAATARDALAIFSPSRVFMEIGRFVSEGLAIGIDQAADQPVSSVSSMAGQVVGVAAEHVTSGLFAGAGGPRDDANLVRISDGEYVVNARATAQNLPLLEAVNAGRPILARAEGGAVGRTVQEMRPLHGLPYVYGGSSGRTWDCSGLSSGAFNGVTGKGINAGRKFTTESNFESMGFRRGVPPNDLANKVFWIGVSRGGGGPNSHMAANLGSVPIESSSSGVRIGSGTRGARDPQFNLHWWLPPQNYSPPGVGEERKPVIPGMIPTGGGTADAGAGAAVAQTSTTPVVSPVAQSQSPSSWSEVAGIGAKAFAEGQVKDALGVLGIPDALPPALKAARDLEAARRTTTSGESATIGTPAVRVPAASIDPAPTEVGGGDRDAALRHAYDPRGGAEQWRPTVARVFDIAGWPQSNVSRTVQQIKIESGGNPKARNDWDVNAKRGVPSIGLLQVIKPTFDAMRSKYPKIAGFPNDQTDPAASIGAGTGWAYHRYGGPEKVWPTAKGYATGGTVTGGTGVRDDVVIRAMGGEEMVRRTSAEAARPVLRAMNADPAFAATVNQAFTDRGRTQVQPVSTQQTVNHFHVADTAELLARQRIEDSKRAIETLGVH